MKKWIGMVVLCALGAASDAQTGIGGSSEEQIPSCVPGVRDQATGGCVGVSSVPTPGMLYPLGPEFEVTTSTIDARVELVTHERLLAIQEALFLGGVQTLGFGIGIGVSPPLSHALHILSGVDVEILLEADTDNNGESQHPRIRFTQDGGQVETRIGFVDDGGGNNVFAIHNVFDDDMQFDLPFAGTADWTFNKRIGLAADRKAYINDVGHMGIDGSYFSGGADVAEYYPVHGYVEPGDVVAFTGEGLAIEVAVSGAGGRLAGIVSSDPGVVLGLTYTDEELVGENPEDLYAGDRLAAIRHEIGVNGRAPLALTGRVPCKVTAANGAIRAGDLLAVSPIPGHAMKATEAGAVLGTALEPWNTGDGTILVLANLGWFSPTEDLELRMAELEAQVRALLRRR